MPINQTTKVSVSSYQQFNGNNFTTAGVENSYKIGDANLGVYTGVGLTFDGKPASAILDLKGSIPYEGGPVSAGIRVRHNLNQNAQSVQIRLQPATVNIPVGENTNVYATPYLATKIDYKTGDISGSVGIFAGASHKISKNTSVFVEGQIYDSERINVSTTSVNVGLSITM